MRLFQFCLIAVLTLVACGPQDDNAGEGLAPVLGAVRSALGAPTVAITTPTQGATVNDGFFIVAQASDDVSVSRVEFFLDGNFMGARTAPTYTWYWFTQDFSNGPHVLTAKAYDGDGNVTTSAPVSVTVDNDYVAPTVSILSPAQGTTLAGRVSVEVAASDDRSVRAVYLYVDGTRVLILYSAPPYLLNWDSHEVPNGTHTLTAEAWDEQGNRTLSAPVTITVAQPGSAEYDLGRGVPTCPEGSTICDSAALLQGRGPYGPEPHAPNTIGGTCADGTDNSYRNNQIHWLRVSRSDGLPFATGRRVRVDVAVDVDYGHDRVVELFYATDASAPVWTHLASHGLDWDKEGYQVFSSEYVLPAGSVQAVRASYHVRDMYPLPCSTGPYDDHDDLVFGVMEAVDVAAPTVSITAPVANQQITGIFTVKVAAEDDLNVTRVEVYDGVTLLGTDTTAPFTVAWDTRTTTDGAHTLIAKAYDAVGNEGTSVPVSIIVDRNPPGVWITAPAANALVRGTVQLAAGASDDRGVTRVEFFWESYATGPLLGMDTTAPYSAPWDTLTRSDGRYRIRAYAYDIAGNVRESDFIYVTVDNTAPTVAITSPANGGAVSGLSTTIQATASDTNGVTQVAFYDGTKLLGTDTSAPYSYSWGLLLVAKGQHTLTARATDAVGNVTTSAPVVVTVK